MWKKMCVKILFKEVVGVSGLREKSFVTKIICFGIILLVVIGSVLGCGTSEKKESGTDQDANSKYEETDSSYTRQYYELIDEGGAYHLLHNRFQVLESETDYSMDTYKTSDGSVISGYKQTLTIQSNEKEVVQEEVLKYAQIEMLKLMDNGGSNIIELNVVAYNNDKKEMLQYCLRYADVDRSVVALYEDGKYKDLEELELKSTYKTRFFYDELSDKEQKYLMEDYDTLYGNVLVSSLMITDDKSMENIGEIVLEAIRRNYDDLSQYQEDYMGIEITVMQAEKEKGRILVTFGDNPEEELKLYKVTDEENEIETVIAME